MRISAYLAEKGRNSLFWCRICAHLPEAVDDRPTAGPTIDYGSLNRAPADSQDFQ